MHNWKLFFLFLNQNISCGYSKEPSQWDGSLEHPKHMFKLMDKKITVLAKKDFLNWFYVTHSRSQEPNFTLTFKVNFYKRSADGNKSILKKLSSMQRVQKTCLKTYAAISNAHLSCVCKRGKLSGSCLSTINGFGSTQLPIFLCHIGVPTFSWQNKVKKVCPKYLHLFRTDRLSTKGRWM